MGLNGYERTNQMSRNPKVFRANSAVAIGSLVLLTASVGCSKTDGVESAYGVENCKVVSMTMNTIKSGGCLRATVTGPAADLAVFVTSPDGKIAKRDSGRGEEAVEIIQKKRMMTNRAGVSLLMSNGVAPKAGTWVLTVKTVEPEKIVLQKKITITQEMLTQARNGD